MWDREDQATRVKRLRIWNLGNGTWRLFLILFVLFLFALMPMMALNVGSVLLAKGAVPPRDYALETAQATQWFKNAIDLRPGYSRAILGLARSYLWGGDFADAEESLLQLDPRMRSAPLFALGANSSRSEEWDRAIAAYRLGIQLDPWVAASGHLYVARILQHIGDPVTGLADLQAAVALDSYGAWLNPYERAETYLRLGNTLYLSGVLDSAQASFEMALAITGPDGPSEITGEALAGLARVFLERGQLDRALTTAQDGATRFPANDQNYIVLGHIYSRMGQAEQARQMYDAAKRIVPWRDETLKALDEPNDR